MKNIWVLTVLIILFSIFSCDDNHPVKYTTFDKYSVQNYSNWVEITEIVPIQTCLLPVVYKGGLLIKDTFKLAELVTQSKIINPGHNLVYSDIDSCMRINKIFENDFTNTDIILYYRELDVRESCSRKIYKNEQLKIYLYLAEITQLNDSTKIILYNHFSEELKIPTIPFGYTLKFDTIIVNKTGV